MKKLLIATLVCLFTQGGIAQDNEVRYNVYYYIHKGRLNSKVKDYRRAIQDFDRALRMQADNVEALHLRGNASYALGNYRDAILDYDRAISILEEEMGGGRDPEATYIEGDEGISVFNSALASGNRSDLASYYNNRGAAHFQIGYDKLARKDFEQALSLDPSLQLAQQNLDNMGDGSYSQSGRGNRSSSSSRNARDLYSGNTYQSQPSVQPSTARTTTPEYAANTSSSSLLGADDRDRNRYAPRTYKPIPKKQEPTRNYAQTEQERLDRYNRGKTYPVLPYGYNSEGGSYSYPSQPGKDTYSYDQDPYAYQNPDYPPQADGSTDPYNEPSDLDFLSQDNEDPVKEFERIAPSPEGPGYQDYERVPSFEQRPDSLSFLQEETYDRSLPPAQPRVETDKRTLSGEFNKIFGNGKKRVVDYPAYDFPMSDKASIKKIDLSKTETKVHLDITNTANRAYYFIVPGPHSGSTFYLQGKEGEVYRLTKVTGLSSTKRQTKLEIGDAVSFTLHFDPIPMDKRYVDLVDGRTNRKDTWNFTNIDLQ
ncbi:MAG: tetratricopeptide repeat protein [Bacteroidota bacterium]